MFNLFGVTAYAQQQVATAGGGAGQVPAAGGLIGAFLPFIIMIAVFYFLLIRPQKKQEKKTKQMLASLQVGDKVVTIGGICGKIAKLKDNEVYVESGFVGNPNERSVIKFERSAIKTVLTIHDDQA